MCCGGTLHLATVSYLSEVLVYYRYCLFDLFFFFFSPPFLDVVVVDPIFR